MFLYSLLSAYAVERFAPIAKWLTVGILAAVLLVGGALFFLKRKAFAPYVKAALIAVAAYLLCLAVVFFALDIAKNYSDSYTEENWLDKQTLTRFVLIPLLCLCATLLFALLAFLAVAKYKPSWKKKVTLSLVSTCGVALITTLVCLSVYYNQKIADDGYYNSDTASVKQLSLYLFAALCIGILASVFFLDKEKLTFDARSLAYAGVCAGMSFALSYIKLWDMPQGGSITLVSLLPVMLYAYIFGAKKGVFVGFAYGVLQAVQDPWIIHPAQFLLDYPVAFSAAGLAGLLRENKALKNLPQGKFALGAMLAGAMRFICHVLSGALAFEAYAEGQNVWLYSLVYNSYVFIDVALVIAAGVFILSSRSFVKTIERIPTK